MNALQKKELTALTVPAPPAELKRSESHELSLRQTPNSLKKWLIRAIALAVVVTLGLAGFWYQQRATVVAVVLPVQSMITETITSSGRVRGVTETNAGAQAAGVVKALYVEEGSVVSGGQQIALIKNDVAEAQINQAQSAVATARTLLAQVSRGNLSSDIDAAMEQVRQTQAVVEQQNASITQAQQNVLGARSLGSQFEAQRDLAKKELGRNKTLMDQGVVSRADYDTTNTAYQVAVKKVAAQNQAVQLALAGVTSARAGLKSAQASVRTQQARLKTVQLGARPEDIAVANQRITEAENALSVARKQAANAVVTAPFDGTVTAINAQVGQTVGANGVVTLVSSQLEIRLDVDESNLAALAVGQPVVISSGVFADTTFRGEVSDLGAAVDQTRGTIEIKVIPSESPVWLRPGQTVDVNIITAENVSRLLVPQTALGHTGDSTVVFTIVAGKAVPKTVTTRATTKDGVPVIAGLTAADSIIQDVTGITTGTKVRAK